MAELADAHGSGPCESDFMQVQVLSSAPVRVFITALGFFILLNFINIQFSQDAYCIVQTFYCIQPLCKDEANKRGGSSHLLNDHEFWALNEGK